MLYELIILYLIGYIVSLYLIFICNRLAKRENDIASFKLALVASLFSWLMVLGSVYVSFYFIYDKEKQTHKKIKTIIYNTNSVFTGRHANIIKKRKLKRRKVRHRKVSFKAKGERIK